jgi:hypothetical protein
MNWFEMSGSKGVREQMIIVSERCDIVSLRQHSHCRIN